MTKFQCHAFFPSENIKQNVLLSFYLDNLWHKAMADGENGENGNTKILISKQQKEIFRRNKCFIII